MSRMGRPVSSKKPKSSPRSLTRRAKIIKEKISPNGKMSVTSKTGKNLHKSLSTGTLETFFAKAKPAEMVPCPVCLEHVKKTLINSHLDRGCLKREKKSVLELDTEEQAINKQTQDSPKTGFSSPGRGLAKLKSDLKDQRKQERLKKKVKNEMRYRNINEMKAVSPDEEVIEIKDDCIQVQSIYFKGTKSHNKDEAEYNTKSKGVKGGRKRKLSLSRIRKTSHPTSMQSCSSDITIMDNQVDLESTNVPSLSFDKREVPFRTKGGIGSSSKSSLYSLDDNQKRSKNSSEYSPASCKHHDNQTKEAEASGSTSEIEVSSDPDVELLRNKRNSFPDIFEHLPISESCDKTDSGSTPLLPQEQCVNADKLSYDNKLTSSDIVLTYTESMEDSSQVHLRKTARRELSYPTSQESTDTELELSNHNENYLPSCSSSVSTLSSLQEGSNKMAEINGHRLEPLPSLPSNDSLGDFVKPLSQRSNNSEHLSSPSSNRSSQGSPHKPKEPYYVANFKIVLNTVLANADDRSLLNEKDFEAVDAFNRLSVEAQQLYIRLFQRKFAWLKVSRLEYPKIAQDLAPVAEELCKEGLCIGDENLSDLEEMLGLIMAPDLKLLAKELKVNCTSGQKSDLVVAVVRHCCKQKGLFGGNLKQVLKKKAKKYLGRCIKLEREARAVFTRICLLFSPVLMTEDEDKSSGGQSQLQTLLLVNFGKVSFPTYKINRTRKIFRTRDDLLRYEVAVQYDNDISAALSINNFELAHRLWESAKNTFEGFNKKKDITNHDKSLPVFLQSFTASSVYTSIMYQGVEILQKMRKYREAVDLLKTLLASSDFRNDCRGRWWERLALNLDQHLKNPNQALDVIKEGLADQHVKTGHRLALRMRVEKIFKSSSNKKLTERRAEEFKFEPLPQLPELKIQGPILPYTSAGVKTTFYRQSQNDRGEDEGVEICKVEQIALDHYLSHGYTNGKHGEGSIFSTLVFLLFWDELFMDIPDVFSYPYQAGPLDLRTDAFFKNREQVLKDKLERMKKADGEALGEWLEVSWLEHEEENVSGISWTLYTLQEAKELLSCMGGAFFTAVAERILRDHRHCRGGMPDLIVWNHETKKFKMSEVKGPGDRLAHKQILWIDFFLSIGGDAEVCYVEGVKSKQLKRPIKESPKSSPRKLKKFRQRSSEGTPKKSQMQTPT